MKLERVEISRLRGIPGDWPALNVGNKGLIVYGPNGVGKSSIIDALEATIGKRSSLFKDNRADGVNWNDAAPHVKGGPPSCTAYGTMDGRPCSITLGATPAADLTDWVDAASTASFVLRRYMLLEFIDAMPKDRYVQIEPFLNLGAFVDLERQLKDFFATLETQIATLVFQRATKIQAIQQTFGLSRNLTPARSTLIEALKVQLTNAGLQATDDDVIDLPALAATLTTELGGEAISQKLAALGSIRHQAQQLPSASTLLELYTQTIAAADELFQVLRSSAHKTPVRLLNDARDHIAATVSDSCPICEQTIYREALLDRLKERIDEDEAVRLSSEILAQKLGALGQASSKAQAAYSSFQIAWASNLGLEPLPECYGAATKLFAQLQALNMTNAGSAREELRDAFSQSECEPISQIERIDAAIAVAGGGERRAALAEAESFVKSLTFDVPAFEEFSNQLIAIEKRKGVAAQLHAHAEAARKEAVQKIADRVADIANDFYEKIHPNENIATAKLTVRSATAGSIVLSSSFYGEDAPPLKYYSESHLDTLGLCFFLAIRKLELSASPKFRLLLIDDVLHSVDAEHRTRLARLLKEHFFDNQIVLVTHDKNFYDRLKATLGSGYSYIAISSWDIDSGPHMSDPSTDLDRVLHPATRAGKSHDELAAAGGRFFEWLLKELTERLQVPIPARFSFPHDIGSMWPALASKLERHNAFTAAHPNLVAGLNDNAWVRNKLGAHDSSEAAIPVQPAEVIEFLDGVAVLYKATMCSDCATAIQMSRDDRKIWRCGCSELQYSA